MSTPDPILAMIDAMTAAQLEALAGRLAVYLPLPQPAAGGRSPYGARAEVAAHSRTPLDRVDYLLGTGRLTRVKDGGRVLIAWAEVDAYLAGEKTGPLAAEVARLRKRDAAG